MSRGDGGSHGRERYKRPFDLCVVATATLVLLPVLVALVVAIPLAIRLESPGPALYRQTRLGRDGRVFRMLKFRTMVDGAETRTGPVWAAWRDARTTAVGRVLRRLHLDELPQIVNVLRGEMSLVGPRPERPELAARIERDVPCFPERLRVRPGIMGLAQALGPYHLHPRRKLHYDIIYIATMSPWLDVRLSVLCVRKVLHHAVRSWARHGRFASQRWLATDAHQNPAAHARCIVARTGGNSRAAMLRRRTPVRAAPPRRSSR